MCINIKHHIIINYRIYKRNRTRERTTHILKKAPSKKLKPPYRGDYDKWCNHTATDNLTPTISWSYTSRRTTQRDGQAICMQCVRPARKVLSCFFFLFFLEIEYVYLRCIFSVVINITLYLLIPETKKTQRGTTFVSIYIGPFAEICQTLNVPLYYAPICNLAI